MSNIRIIGVLEDDQLSAFTDADSQLLKEAFDLPEESLLDRAHRTLAPKTKTHERPCAIVANLLHCVKILSRARELQRIKVNNMTILVFPIIPPRRREHMQPLQTAAASSEESKGFDSTCSTQPGCGLLMMGSHGTYIKTITK